ncbi:hypothetical protein B0H21DRAFT_740693 [Amylocystis lapponica]|nr:hypothetical protein B0H21DRAFT_740693 [Amylocystis lapponica]
MSTSAKRHLSIVPRPPHAGSFSLKASMDPDLSSEKFRKFTSGVRELIGKYLDERKRFEKQDLEKRQHFLDEACQRFNILDRYEDAWPAEGYAMQYLRRRAYEHRRCSCRNKNTSPSSGHSVENLVRRPPTPILQPPAPILQLPAPIWQSERISKRVHARREHQPVPANHTRQTSFIQHTPSGSTHLDDFLHSMKPNMEGLAMRFIAAGIVDTECLRGLAGLPEAEQHLFLKEDICLDPFQMRVLRVGLNKIS